MKHRWFAALMITVMIFIQQPSVLFCTAKGEDVLVTEAYFDREETLSGWREVPGKGAMRYYAQNDGLWENFTYESRDSKKNRPFGDGGCAPAATAMAIYNMVDREKLSLVRSVEKQPYSLCPCALNAYKCRGNHARYTLTTARDFERFLPLCFADFACGNNTLSVLSRNEEKGTSTGFIHHLARVYGLNVTIVNGYENALEALSAGKSVVAHSSAGSVFTNTGHYVFLAAADDERLYVLDPLCRETYTTKNSKRLTVHEPGLVSIRHEDIRAAGFGSYIIFSDPALEPTPAPAPETPVLSEEAPETMPENDLPV